MRASVGAAIVCALLATPTAASAEPATQKRGLGGWTTFGGELGFFTGMATTVGLLLGASDDDTGAALVVGSSLVLGVGGTAVGMWGFRRLAANNAWDRHEGWGAAGVFPGFMGGFVLAAGSVLAATGDSSSPALRFSVGALGGGLGAALGYFAFRAMSRARGDGGWEHLFYWLSFFACETVALIATARTGERNVGVGFILIGVGAAMGTAFTHLIAS